VDTICIDKTGTLTEGALRVVEVLPAPGTNEESVPQILGAVAASASARNITLQAIADANPAEAEQTLGEVPFSSRRRWSAVQVPGGTYLGAPGRVPVGDLEPIAEQRQSEGRRVLALARGPASLPVEADERPPGALEPLGLVVQPRSSVRT
jgi:cation-transporting ATPase E